MFCPECETDYEEGVSVCADCGVALVDEDGDGQEEHEETEFVALVESTDVVFFSLLTGALEEAGIPWFVQGEESLGLLPRDGRHSREPGVQVAVVYVGESRLEAARRMVEALDPVKA
jgi:hypothetical protein